MTEEWREIPGFEGYEVSDLGRVRSFRIKGNHSGKFSDEPYVLKLHDNGNGYKFVHLSIDGKVTKGLVHRLMAKSFLTGPEAPEVAHWNGIRDDNRVDNLRWATVGENQGDRKRHGTHGIKLSESQALAIIDLYVPGEITQQQIADQFGISQIQVSRIIRNESWKHLV